MMSGKLVADHLGDGAHCAEHGKLVVAPPSRHENGDLIGRADGKEKEDAAIDDERRHVAPVRDDAKGEDGRAGNQDRREEVHDLVGPRRHDVLLDQHLDPVGHRLEEPERTDPIWPVAVLDAGENFSLKQRHESEEGEKDNEQRDDVEQAGGNLPNPVRRAGEQRQEPLLSNHENLVEKTAHVAMKKSGVCFLKQVRNRDRSPESRRNAQRHRALIIIEGSARAKFSFCFFRPLS